MKFLTNVILNPLWLFNHCCLHTWAAVAGGAISIGGSLLSSSSASSQAAKQRRAEAERLKNVSNPSEFSERGINLRRFDAFPRILETRRDFDKQFLDADLTQMQRADSGIRNMISDDINPAFLRDRQSIFNRGVRDFNQTLNEQGGAFRQGLLSLSPELARAGEGLEQEDEILNLLRGQAQQEISQNGQLSGEQLRGVQQGSASAVGQRGRGAGAFGVGQLALSRQGAVEGRQDRARGFGFNVLNQGGESQRRNLLQSSQFTSPFLNILSQNQQFANQQAISPLQRLQIAQEQARFSSPDIPVFDPAMLQMESLKLGQGGIGAQIGMNNAARQEAAIGGAASGSGSIFGGVIGNGGFSGMFGGGGGGNFANSNAGGSLARTGSIQF